MEQTNWTAKDYKIYWDTFSLQADEKYRQFHKKILRAEQEIIGIRTPLLKKSAKEIAKNDWAGFLAVTEKDTYEQRVMFGLVLGESKMDYETFLGYCDTYVYDFVDSWALCDVFVAAIKKHVSKKIDVFYDVVKKYLVDENPWVVRVGIVMLLDYYVKEEYIEEIYRWMDEIQSDFYYVQMAKAWLLSLAWIRFPSETKEYALRMISDLATKRMFVQKCCDSFRVSDEDKAWLRAWRKDGFPVG